MVWQEEVQLWPWILPAHRGPDGLPKDGIQSFSTQGSVRRKRPG